MSEKASTAVGMVTGLFVKIIIGDIVLAILVAFFTGAAAYAGQLAVKAIHQYFKNKKSSS